jgi:hypothetical protein
MIKCSACKRGYLRQDYGGDIECSECSRLFIRTAFGLEQQPDGQPITKGYRLTSAQRRAWFFDRLVAGKSSQQIVDELRQEGIADLCESTVRSWRDNHYEEINAAKGNRYEVKIVTPAR